MEELLTRTRRNTPPALIVYAPSLEAINAGYVDRTIRHLTRIHWDTYDPVVPAPSKLIEPPNRIHGTVKKELFGYVERIRDGGFALVAVAGTQDTDIMCQILRTAYASEVPVSTFIEAGSPLAAYYHDLFRRKKSDE